MDNRSSRSGLITDEYLELMREAHERYDFGVSGAQWAGVVLDLCAQFETKDVLDYGCGQRHLAASLPFPIACYDPAIPEYAADPDPADIVICTDVLEHIEPDCLSAVLGHLDGVTKKHGFFVAATRKASKVLADGRNAHLIIEPAEWWHNKLLEAGFIIVAQTTGRKGEAIFHVK